MRCVSVAGSLENVINQMSQGDMAEIRMDLIDDLSLEDIASIFSMPVNTLATCRAGKLPEEKRKQYLFQAVMAGAHWVDLDVSTDMDFLEEMKELLRERHCKLILSYHDCEKTPSFDELRQIQKKCAELEADLVKIAVLAKNKKEVARVLGLYDSSYPTLAISMGEIGQTTRFMALFLGAPFTFVAPDNGAKTAPGQIIVSEFTTRWEKMQNGIKKA